MNKQVRILPGTPDDANREYLPERIKTTDIVVNENGNNSIVYPEHLQEFHGVVADGLETRKNVSIVDAVVMHAHMVRLLRWSARAQRHVVCTQFIVMSMAEQILITTSVYLVVCVL